MRVRANSLLSENTKSCGCIHMERAKLLNRSHGRSNSRLYGIWCGMKSRCCNSNDERYRDYGGRGIKICDEWLEDFQMFYDWAMSNGYNEELSIDRVDNDGNYEPSNCRWATVEEQSNNRRSNRLITIDNTAKTLSEWCDEFNFDYYLALSRLHRYGDGCIDKVFSKDNLSRKNKTGHKGIVMRNGKYYGRFQYKRRQYCTKQFDTIESALKSLEALKNKVIKGDGTNEQQ